MHWEMLGSRTVQQLVLNTCLLANQVTVWWEDVCEDALTSKGLNTQLRVIGGGARNATDKVLIFCDPYEGLKALTLMQIFQDNSLGGKYNITGFYADGFGVR